METLFHPAQLTHSKIQNGLSKICQNSIHETNQQMFALEQTFA